LYVEIFPLQNSTYPCNTCIFNAVEVIKFPCNRNEIRKRSKLGYSGQPQLKRKIVVVVEVVVVVGGGVLSHHMSYMML
jgi:hypothetical protein